MVTCHGVSEDITKQPEDRIHIKTETFKRLYFLLKDVAPFATVQALEKIIEGKQTDGGVLFSFDEAYSGLTKVIPMLIKDGCGAILLPVQLATKKGFFLKSNVCASATRPQNRVLSRNELLRMQSLGATIGSHTVSHPNLCAISEDEVIKEVVQSKQYFESITGKKISWLAYPGGAYDKKVLNKVREAGYNYALTIKPGFVDSGTESLEIPRVDVVGSADNAYYSLARITGLESIFRRKFYNVS